MECGLRGAGPDREADFGEIQFSTKNFPPDQLDHLLPNRPQLVDLLLVAACNSSVAVGEGAAIVIGAVRDVLARFLFGLFLHFVAEVVGGADGAVHGLDGDLLALFVGGWAANGLSETAKHKQKTNNYLKSRKLLP